MLLKLSRNYYAFSSLTSLCVYKDSIHYVSSIKFLCDAMVQLLEQQVNPGLVGVKALIIIYVHSLSLMT